MNESRTRPNSDAGLTQRRSLAVRDEERRKSAEGAIAIIKAMKRSPSAPEPEPAPLKPTCLPDPSTPGWVYFAYCAGRIKIGYTTNVANRLTQFVTHAPQPVTLLLSIGGDDDDERSYHEQFAADRVHGEWFRLSYDLRDFLDQHMNDDGFPLLFEAEAAFHAAAQHDLAFITEILNETAKEIENETVRDCHPTRRARTSRAGQRAGNDRNAGAEV